jgi:zinc transport system substrate-binding protein
VPTRTINGHLHPDHAPTAHVAAGSIDPHIWLSPSRLVIQARTVAATLVRIDPAHASGFQTRLEDLVAELEALDSWIAATLSEHQGRSFLVFHPSWGYFADDYGLRQIAIETEGKPPSDAELTEIQHLAKASDISVVFVQPQIAGREARAVADALGAELATLDPLTSDVRATLRRATEAIAASFRD